MDKKCFVNPKTLVFTGYICFFPIFNYKILHIPWRKIMKKIVVLPEVGEVMLRCFSLRGIQSGELRAMLDSIHDIRVVQGLSLRGGYFGEKVLLIDKKQQLAVVVSSDVEFVSRLPIPLINSLTENLRDSQVPSDAYLPVRVSIYLGDRLFILCEVPVYDLADFQLRSLNELSYALFQMKEEELEDILECHGIPIIIPLRTSGIEDGHDSDDSVLYITGSPVTIAVLREKYGRKPIGVTYY